MLSEDEVDFRRVVMARLFDAWPMARSDSRVLDEYVNATRAVPLRRLAAVVDDVIAKGGDFIPPAGEVIRRYYRGEGTRYHPHLLPAELARDVQLLGLREYSTAARAVAPIGDGLEAERERLALLAEGPEADALLGPGEL